MNRRSLFRQAVASLAAVAVLNRVAPSSQAHQPEPEPVETWTRDHRVVAGAFITDVYTWEFIPVPAQLDHALFYQFMMGMEPAEFPPVPCPSFLLMGDFAGDD